MATDPKEGLFMDMKEVLKLLGDRQRLVDTAIIIDPLSQELIHKAAGPHSPIAIDELGKFQFGLRGQALARLHRLERMGVFTSDLVYKDGHTRRVFSITPIGKATDIARIIWRPT